MKASEILRKNLLFLGAQISGQQQKAADAIGTSQPNVSRWIVNVHSFPPAEFLKAIADYFEVSVDSLLSADLTAEPADQRLYSIIRRWKDIPEHKKKVIEAAIADLPSKPVAQKRDQPKDK